MADCFLQIRTEKKDKEEAAQILEQLGTNLSSVVNMLLKQIIETQSIPFEISRNKSDEIKSIRSIVAQVYPSDLEEKLLQAKTEEDRIFYERLNNYFLQVGQKMAIERNVF